jgi:hypothetical protein
LVATSLLNELHNVTNERAALGSAWPLSGDSGYDDPMIDAVLDTLRDEPTYL